MRSFARYLKRQPARLPPDACPNILIRFNLCALALIAICTPTSTSAYDGQEAINQLKLEVFSQISRIPGWCTEEKAMHFIDLVLETRPQLCVELGIFAGRSLYPVAKALELIGEGMVIGIDPWSREEAIRYCDPKKDQKNIAWWKSLDIDSFFYHCSLLVRSFGLEDYVDIVQGSSEEASAWIDGPIDILHIDGNHSEIGSLLDVELYLPKVRSGGYIWFNDALWAQRKKACDMLCEQCDVVKSIDGANCFLFKKR